MRGQVSGSSLTIVVLVTASRVSFIFYSEVFFFFFQRFIFMDVCELVVCLCESVACV